MGFFHDYPYTDFHEINLDWILRQIMKLHHDWSEFKAVNEITNAGAWDITKQYQAWTIVSDNNAGYISLKPVPAGVAIDNTEYWGLIADYDILITDLTDRIIALENTVGDSSSGLVKDVSDLQGDMTAAENTLNTLVNTTIPSISNSIGTLDHRITLLDDKKYIFIADSYANESDFVTKVNTTLGLTAGVNSFCNAQGGEGFTKGGNDNNGYLYELQQHAAGMSAALKLDITDILVIGGANDAEDNQAYGSNTIYAKALEFVNYAHTNFPNAKIHIGFVGACKYNSAYLENRTQTNLELMRYYYRDTAISLGCAYINNLEYATRWLPGLTLKADGLHPNGTGGTIIAEGIAQYILTGQANLGLDAYPMTVDWINPAFTGAVTASLSMENGKMNLHLNEIALINKSVNFAGGNAGSTTRTNIATFAEVFANEPVHVTSQMYVSTQSPYVFPVDLQLEGKQLSMVIMYGNGSGWYDVTMTNGIAVINPTDLVFDSISMA